MNIFMFILIGVSMVPNSKHTWVNINVFLPILRIKSVSAVHN